MTHVKATTDSPLLFGPQCPLDLGTALPEWHLIRVILTDILRRDRTSVLRQKRPPCSPLQRPSRSSERDAGSAVILLRGL